MIYRYQICHISQIPFNEIKENLNIKIYKNVNPETERYESDGTNL